jgi:hypothetical protein
MLCADLVALELKIMSIALEGTLLWGAEKNE